MAQLWFSVKRLVVIFIFSLVLLPPAFYVLSIGVKNWVDKKIVQTWSREESRTELVSFLSQISGVQKLQVAELKQVERVTRKSRKKVFWEKLELPIVVVSVEVPVTYTYFIDLEKKWSAFEEAPGRWVVVAPDLEFNPPAPEISKMLIKVEKSSLFRNEQEIKNQLMAQMSDYLRLRADDHKELAVEKSRKELVSIIKKWLLHHQKNSSSIEVFFSKEVEPKVLDSI